MISTTVSNTLNENFRLVLRWNTEIDRNMLPLQI
jgi:hypothetical protein